jgi:hypothetical protein
MIISMSTIHSNTSAPQLAMLIGYQRYLKKDEEVLKNTRYSNLEQRVENQRKESVPRMRAIWAFPEK